MAKKKDIIPTLKHVIKALAWDSLFASCLIQAETADTEQEQIDARRFRVLMEQHLNLVGEKITKKETWSNGK